jgi:DNA mismatch endonuclease (patch repair protein)
MRRIRSKNSAPEMQVRQLLHASGYRYRLHDKSLPGKPDIVFKGRRKIIFVHGCFWHQHEAPSCLDGRRPKSNTGYWHPKLAKNVERDAQHIEQLEADGWTVLTIWECQVKNKSSLASQLTEFLGPPRRIAKSGDQAAPGKGSAG